MSLPQRVAARLAEEEIDFSVIGAGAMAVHGVARSTMDLDLLVTQARVLDEAMWRSFGGEGDDEVEIRRGDADDPLAGVVRLASPGERSVDLVVGKHRWQRGVVARAEERAVAGLDLPVVTLADLVLLKLFAGGPQDAWDLEQLLAVAGPAVAEEVDHRIEVLPRESRDLWRRIAPR